MRSGSARYFTGVAIAALLAGLLTAEARATPDTAPQPPIHAAPADVDTDVDTDVEGEDEGLLFDEPEDPVAVDEVAEPDGEPPAPAAAAPAEPAAAPPPAEAATPAPSIDALVPVPEPANVPPPGLNDIAPPVETAAPPAPPLQPAAETTTPVAQPPRPAEVVVRPAVDVAVGEALRAALTDRTAQGEDKKLREALLPVYEARGFKPLWVEQGTISPRADQVRATLADAAAEGLNPADYALPAAPEPTDAAALASTELKTSIAAVTYARHAMSGRFDPARVHPLVTPRRTIPKPDEVLAALAAAADPGAALAAYNPPHAGYRALKTILAEMRLATAPDQPARIPAGPLLRPGGRDPRVPALRARLGVAGDSSATTYDPELVEAVKAFQDTHDLSPDGVVGSQTLAALNGDRTATVNDIIANMERWRWLPRELGRTHIMVNIPEFTVRIWRDDRMIHRTRVVTGKPATPTPVFSENMDYVVINPAWNVPPSIVRNEMLPLLASDPDAITRQGLEVVVNGRVVDPYEVYGIDPNRISFRQPPGERNALGRIKFMFPNQHYVYLHDTPSRSLFQRDVRAFSHGCIRVHEPLKFGEVVFDLGMPGESWPPSRIESMYGREEHIIKFRERFPVHVVYFTAMVDETGTLVVRDDIYRHNAQVKALLGLEGTVRPFVRPSSPKPVSLTQPPDLRPVEPPPTFLEELFGLRPPRRG